MSALREADALDSLVESAAATLCHELGLHKDPHETALSALTYAVGPEAELVDVPEALRLFGAAVLASAGSGPADHVVRSGRP